MRKSAILFALILLAWFASPSFAAVGIQVGNTLQGTATDIRFASNSGGQITNDGSVWTFNVLLAGIGNSGATSMTTADLAIPLAYGFVKKAIEQTDTAFIAGTLADGVPGQMLTLYITAQHGSQVYTVTPATSSQFVTIGFDAVGETATFLYIDDTEGWVVWSYTGATVTFTP